MRSITVSLFVLLAAVFAPQAYAATFDWVTVGDALPDRLSAPLPPQCPKGQQAEAGEAGGGGLGD
jgi:hypothetical protein